MAPKELLRDNPGPDLSSLIISSSFDNLDMPLSSLHLSSSKPEMQVKDAFDGSNEPIIYMSDNKMPFSIEFNITYIYIGFAALALALLFILPGIRRAKLVSLVAILGLLTAGASILLALNESSWLLGELHMNQAPYGAFTGDTITGRLAVHIGLSSANVTLTGKIETPPLSSPFIATSSSSVSNRTIDYNERFHWDQPNGMQLGHLEALRRGLPYPILSVTEFFSHDLDGFNWTFRLRKAGYYSSFFLYCALASCCVAAATMCLLPSFLPRMMLITGALEILSVSQYTIMIQSPGNFNIQLASGILEFSYGYTYFSTLIVGATAILIGILMSFLHTKREPHKQFTILDSDSYVTDKKALWQMSHPSLNSSKQSSLTSSLCCLKSETGSNPEIKANSSLRHNTSEPLGVTIPIADIEEKFRSISEPTTGRHFRGLNNVHSSKHLFWTSFTH